MKLLKLLPIFGLCLGLAACDQEILVVPKHTAFTVPAGFTECNLADLPKEFRSNKQVAEFLAQVYSDNKLCFYNMEAIKKIIAKMKEVIK